MKILNFHFLILLLILGCTKMPEVEPGIENLTIFYINDQHGEINNFSKIKHIIDQEKKLTKVLLVCGGDVFSGNPIVDNYTPKGYPMIDIMNRVGFDVSVIGNHEFDYGEDVLKERIDQSEFAWICANVDMSESIIGQPLDYKTISIDGLKITFLGLVETTGKGDIPLTHPWKIKNIQFIRPENVVTQYADLKETEESDLLIALTHLGHQAPSGAMGDFKMAEEFPYFDMIIGGHSSVLLNEVVNGIPVVQAGRDLNYIGKVNLTISDRKIESYTHELIDLNEYEDFDQEIQELIEVYDQSMPELDEVIGYSHTFHERFQVGCFYTDALNGQIGTDISFQNSGGVRTGLDEGEISRREIYEIDPFSNGTVSYTMSVEELKTFLKESGGGYYYSGMEIFQIGQEIIIESENGVKLDNELMLNVGINDFIPAVNSEYFPAQVTNYAETTAETIINYLIEKNDQVNYPSCTRNFRYE